VRTASPEAIAALPGFSLKAAAKIQAALLRSDAASAPDAEAKDDAEQSEALTTLATNLNQNES
jgi:hypothetical protein